MGSFAVNQPAFAVALSNDTAFIGLADGQIQVWNLSEAPVKGMIKKELMLHTTDLERATRKEMTAICAMNENGTLIAVGYDNGDLHIVCSQSQKSMKIDLPHVEAANDRISWITCIPGVTTLQR